MDSRSYHDKLVIAANQNVKEKKYWQAKFAGDLKKSSFTRHSETQAANRGKGLSTKKFDEISVEIKNGFYEKLKKLSNDVDFKLYIILVAGLVAILYRYTCNNDIIVGTTINKQEEEIDFINTILALRNQIDENITFKELLLQVRQTILEAIEHQNYPIEILVEDLNMKFSNDEFPLFDVLIILENIHDKKYIRNINYNMLFCFTKVNGCVQGVIEYDAVIYDRIKTEGIIKQYMLLLEDMHTNVDVKISRIDILSPEEKKRLLCDFNDTDFAYPAGKLIHEMFAERARESPDYTALMFKDVQLSYGELNRRANRLSATLRSLIEPASFAAVMTEPSLEMIISILGILKAGGAFLPVDARLPASRIKFILEDSGAEVLLTSAGLLNIIDYPVRNINLEDEAVFHADDANQSLYIDPVSPAYLIYTSGTTGRPKGVIVEHRNVTAYLFAFFREFEITAKDIIVQNSSYSFDIFIEELFPVLVKGGKIAIPQSQEKEDFYLLQVFINKVNARILDGTPLMLNELNSLNKDTGIRTYISGGDVLKKEYITNLINYSDVYNTYGPTETTICASYYKCTNTINSSFPIGKPIGNYKIYILDRNSRLLPTGATGELCIAGPGVTRGYLNKPSLTAEKFIKNPYAVHSNNRLYRTGDLVRWLPDGNIEFSGRIDNQVNIRGYRIELREIESKLLTHRDIKEAVVVEKDKGKNKFLCAYYISDKKISKSELQEFVSLDLPAHMAPTFFVPLETLPLTPGGKIDIKELRERDILSGVEYAAPGNEIEKILGEIWAEVLQLEKDTISIDANFFELGGHSLKATILIAKIHKELEVKVPLVEVFRFQTIRELAEYIVREAEQEKFVAVEPVEEKEYYVLSSAQKRLYSVQQLDPESTAYNIGFGFSLGENVAPERVRQPFIKLIKRHEILRSSFAAENNQAVQRVHREVEFEVELYQAGNQAEAGGKLEEIAKNFRRPFDLSKAPLFRVGLIEIPGKGYVLLVDLHHIIIDDACTDILTRELIALYLDEELPCLKLQYKDYAEWQNRLIETQEIKKQEEYWLKLYEGHVPLLELKADFNRPAVHDFAGGRIFLEIPADLTLKLKKEILRHGANINVFMAVFNILLAKLSDQEDIIVGCPVSGRTHIDLQGIVGMFLNMLPIRNQPAANKTYIEFLQEVKENTLQAYENQDYQFDELIEKIDFKRVPGRHPLVDAVLVVLDQDESLATVPDQREMVTEDNPTKNETIAINIIPDHSIGITSKFDLEIWVSEVGNRIDMALIYAACMFKRSSALKILELYFDILRQVLENENIMLKDIKISTDFLTARSKISKEIEFNF